MIRYPFEVTVAEIENGPDPYVDAVFSCLSSEFLIMPRGAGFLDYGTFEHAYETLKQATRGFVDWNAARISQTILDTPPAFIVLRSMLGFTPPEWAYVTTEESGVEVTQGAARSLDRKVRMTPDSPLRLGEVTAGRLIAMVETACKLLVAGAPEVPDSQLHRLDKADTSSGNQAMANLATLGVPYAMLLYERFLGRPFAGHRDSVSERIGDGLETAIEEVLQAAGISFRKTRRAERLPGFDQAPDFVVPSEFNPKVVIEAKITEDDGTARDKVTRIQHLDAMSREGQAGNARRFQVIACIGGRGFRVRREDMKKVLFATDGKVFTVQTLTRMIDHTDLQHFRSR